MISCYTIYVLHSELFFRNLPAYLTYIKNQQTLFGEKKIRKTHCYVQD